jgi:hypothetical protein
MDLNVVYGNIIWNTALVGVAGFFVKKWINSVDSTATSNKNIAVTTAAEIKEKIEHIVDQMKVANGRTGKIEQNLAVQQAVCEERIRNESCR